MKHIFRLIIFAVAMLLYGSVMAQTVIGTGAVNQLTYQKGGYGADSVFGLPIRDTFCNNFGSFRCKGRITIQPSTNLPYYNDGAKWVGFGNSIDTSLFLVWADTVTYIATKNDLLDYITWGDTNIIVVTVSQLNDSLLNYVTHQDLSDSLSAIDLQYVTDNGNTTTNGITTGGLDNYSSAIGLGALSKIYKQYADSTYFKYTDSTALTSKSWRLGGNTLSQDTALGTLSNHTINFISNGIQRGRLVSSGEWEFGIRTSSGDVTVQGTNPLSKIYRITNTVNNTVGWDYQFNNSSSAQVTYAQTRAAIIANTAGAHSSSFSILTANAGTVDNKFRIYNDAAVIIQNGGTFTKTTNVLLDVVGGITRLQSNVGTNGTEQLRLGNTSTPTTYYTLGTGSTGTGNGEFALHYQGSTQLMLTMTGGHITGKSFHFGSGATGSWLNGLGNTGFFITGVQSFSTAQTSVILGSNSSAIFANNLAAGTATHVQIPAVTNNQFQPPLNSTANYRALFISPIIAQTAAGTTGTSTSIHIQPTLTAAADYRSIFLDQTSGTGILQTSTNVQNQLGRLGVGGAADGTEMLKVTGNMIVTQQYIESVTVSAAGTLTLSTSQNYVFSGTTTTWTLPAVTGTTGRTYKLKNRGSGNVTLNAAAAANEIYTTLGTNTYTLTPGSAIILVSDGVFWNVQ